MKDRDLWLKVAGTVKPLTGKAKKPPPTKLPDTIVVKPVPHAPPRLKTPAAPLGHAKSPGVDASTLHKFRAGKMPVAGTLDLHGMTQTEAHAALSRFILHGYHNGRRCVLVITGKGRESEGRGVLRRNVPRWLDEPALRPCILALTPAKQAHGGDGAFYVLLRRRK
jgi:DNA-nicking Smr family endonuclease